MRISSEKTKSAMLRVLNDAGRPLGAGHLARTLLSHGLDLNPRTVRFYLLQLDKAGFTQLVSRRRGRSITERGRTELSRVNVIRKVGIVAARIDSLACRATFDRATGSGTVIMNVGLVAAEHLTRTLEEMHPVFARGLTMAPRLAILRAGQSLGGVAVPRNQVAVGTVCSITLNGILLHEATPVLSRFGGLLEMREYRPVRFVELIEYRGSTLDPFEVFIKADMTRVRQAAQTGAGVICASFREIPAAAMETFERVERRLRAHGLGGVLAVGKPGQPLFDIPVTDGYCGLIVAGGLNPMAAAHEAGVPLSIRSLVELRDYGEFSDVSRFYVRVSHAGAYRRAVAPPDSPPR